MHTPLSRLVVRDAGNIVAIGLYAVSPGGTVHVHVGRRTAVRFIGATDEAA
jgi:hypothetical protein